MKKISFLIIIFSLVVFSSTALEKIRVLYPNVNDEGKNSFGYAVLKLALENSGVEFDLQLSRKQANNSRIRSMIKSNEVSISDFGTSIEFEQELLPIYFPIDLGLNGWRVFLIHKDYKEVFRKITTIKDLQAMVAGQGTGWSDVTILEYTGLKVLTAPFIHNLFRMTKAKRFDYFPLGANEVYSLLESYEWLSPDIVIEEDIILIYPFARLFFVNKENILLRDIVQKGLEKAFNNGSFWELFRTHESNEALFTKVNLESRKQIVIENPNMSENFKKIPKKYFFTFNMLSKKQ